MLSTLLATKLHRPRPTSSLVARPRLTKRLDEGLRKGHRLFLVVAPAGYGKTTLVTDWLGKTGIPSAWLSLDEADNDPLRFFTYVVAALQKTLGPKLGQPLPEAFQVMPQSPEAFVAPLINDLAAVDGPILLALDDFHLITAGPVQEAMVFLLDHAPPNLHLVVLTRADPPFPLPRLRVRELITEIRGCDLRFTSEEMTLFLNSLHRLKLPAEQITALESRTEGWAAGVQLAALSLEGRSAERAAQFISAFTGSHHYIMDYLAEEVLDRQSAAVREFLLRTSILDRMTASLCDVTLDIHGTDHDSQSILERLERDNLFVIPLDDDRRWYRYHHLFADLLRSRLRQAYPEDMGEMHRRASKWFEKHRLIEEAFNHALAVEDFERAAHLVEQNALPKIQRGELVSLDDWFRALPEAIIQTHPWLCVFQAFEKYWAGPREETVKYIRMAEEALQSASHLSETERDRIEGYIAAVRAFYASQEENVPVIFEMAHKAMALVPESDYVSALCALALVVAYWGCGDVVGAEQTCRQSRIIAMKLDHPMHVTSSAYYESLQQIKRGQLNKAYRTLQDALQWLASREKQDELAAGCLLIRISDILREWNRPDEAWDYLQRGLQLSQRAGFCDYLVDAYLVQARLCLAESNYPGVREANEKALQLTHGVQFDPYVFTWLDEIRLRLWIHEGNLSSVHKWMQSSGLQYEGALDYLHDLDHINLVRAMLALKGEDPSRLHLHQAKQLLDRLSEAAERAGWVHETIKILLLQALALENLGRTAEAIEQLTSALALAEKEGHTRVFLDEGLPMLELLRLAQKRGLAQGSVSRLIAAFAGQGSGRATQPAPAQGILSGRELELLALIAEGRSNREIANELVIAIGTVKRHTVNIFDKLDVRNRTEAVAKARQLGLL